MRRQRFFCNLETSHFPPSTHPTPPRHPSSSWQVPFFNQLLRFHFILHFFTVFVTSCLRGLSTLTSENLTSKALTCKKAKKTQLAHLTALMLALSVFPEKCPLKTLHLRFVAAASLQLASVPLRGLPLQISFLAFLKDRCCVNKVYLNWMVQAQKSKKKQTNKTICFSFLQTMLSY